MPGKVGIEGKDVGPLVHAGRIDPRRLGHDLDAPNRRADPARFVAALARTPDAGVELDRLEPGLRQYGLLKAALRRYRELGSGPELTRLPMLPNDARHLRRWAWGTAVMRW